jgi:uncharacterized protein (DUF1684 family)
VRSRITNGDRVNELLSLADYRRRVYSHYAAVRATDDRMQAWNTWRRNRDQLFVHHEQSPLEPDARVETYAAPFAPYDPGFRVAVAVEPTVGADIAVAHGNGDETLFRPFGTVQIAGPTGDFELTLFWLQAYGGGIFLPFRDATAGQTTYGGGRYLLDTVKGADLGAEDGKLVLDFNYAYHPSCAYSARWSCPLAPPQNRIDVPIPVGELLPT